MNDTEVIYSPEVRPTFPLLSEMFVERGTSADWDLLHHLHYKSAGRVIGAHYWRVSLHGETIGVYVTTLPRPLLKERNIAFAQIKPKGIDDRLSNTARFKSINKNMIALARVVLDTMYRGIGGAYRFKNLVARMSGYQFVESQSAMAKYNMFTERSGFTTIKPMRSHNFQGGIKFMRSTFEANPADTSAIIAEIESMRPAVREATLRSVREFYYKCSALEKTGAQRGAGMSRVSAMPVDELIRQLQQVVLASPVYSIYRNPDFGRQLPERLPLTAFDRQPTDQPLILP